MNPILILIPEQFTPFAVIQCVTIVWNHKTRCIVSRGSSAKNSQIPNHFRRLPKYQKWRHTCTSKLSSQLPLDGGWGPGRRRRHITHRWGHPNPLPVAWGIFPDYCGEFLGWSLDRFDGSRITTCDIGVEESVKNPNDIFFDNTYMEPILVEIRNPNFQYSRRYVN